MKFLSKIGLTLSPLMVCGAFNAQAAPKVKSSKPNIIYIMSDDHSYQAISAYGHPLSRQAPTPNIDRIANEGIIFNRAFVENSLSTPSRACLMTGLYSHQSGQRQLAEGIDTSKVFFPQLLQKNGYQTAVIGKWHMSCEPKGFDFYYIHDDQGEYYNPRFKTKNSDGKYFEEKGYATSLTTKHAIEFMDQRDKKEPFCLFVHYKAPHRNWMPEEKYLSLYENVEFPLPETFWDNYSGKCSAAREQKMSISKDLELIQDLKVAELKDKASTPYEQLSYQFLMGGINRMTPEQRSAWDAFYGPRNKKFLEANLQGDELIKWKFQNYLRDYLRCVRSVDDGVGELLDYLKQHGLDENTIIVYTSDQGFFMGEHNWFDKRFMYEESFRTPLMMRYPKAIKPNTKTDALVQNIDFAPTFLSLASVKKPQEMSGTTLEPLFAGKTPKKWRKSLYYHYYDYPAFHLVRKHDGVRTERYKLIHFYGQGGMRGATTKYQTTEGTRENMILNLLNNAGYITQAAEINCDELYDLEKDPYEMNNLHGKRGYEKITSELQALLNKYREDLKVDEF